MSGGAVQFLVREGSRIYKYTFQEPRTASQVVIFSSIVGLGSAAASSLYDPTKKMIDQLKDRYLDVGGQVLTRTDTLVR